jgi:hypothetical protein
MEQKYIFSIFLFVEFKYQQKDHRHVSNFWVQVLKEMYSKLFPNVSKFGCSMLHVHDTCIPACQTSAHLCCDSSGVISIGIAYKCMCHGMDVSRHTCWHWGNVSNLGKKSQRCLLFWSPPITYTCQTVCIVPLIHMCIQHRVLHQQCV